MITVNESYVRYQKNILADFVKLNGTCLWVDFISDFFSTGALRKISQCNINLQRKNLALSSY